MYCIGSSIKKYYFCDLRGQVEGTAYTFTSCMFESMLYNQYWTFNNTVIELPWVRVQSNGIMTVQSKQAILLRVEVEGTGGQCSTYFWRLRSLWWFGASIHF